MADMRFESILTVNATVAIEPPHRWCRNDPTQQTLRALLKHLLSSVLLIVLSRGQATCVHSL